MRLYLSSYRLGDHPQELVRLMGDHKKIAVISNASDLSADRDLYAGYQIDELTSIGLAPEHLDLRDYFGRADDLAKKLKEYGGVWLKGGNAFLLNRAVAASGFDTIIKDMLSRDEIVYAGFSAGVCIAAPDLRGIELCDEPERVPAGYDPAIKWDGMGLIPYSVAPHYRSDHHESAMIEDVVKYLQDNNIPHRTMQDGDVIVIEGGVEKHLKRKAPGAPAAPKP